ncbi:MAG TPA: GH3 auxin-responsive promoter family protein [Dongiaceae bacterium]
MCRRSWRKFEPQPERARRIAAALRSADLPAIWPKLALVSAWSHGAARGPFEALRHRMPGIVFDGKGLMATEGVVTISHPRRAHPLPALAWSLIEFIGEDGRSHLAHELEPNAIYRIVVTNRTGLYRYDLGDRVLCWQVAGGVPELAFLGRADLTCDMVGEKLDETFVTSCLAQMHTHAILAPLDEPFPHYELLQDVERPAIDTQALESALDANPHYAYARRLGQLGPIRLRRCADLKGAYHRYRQRQGQRLGDIKPPSLLRTPADTAAFLTFLRRVA